MQSFKYPCIYLGDGISLPSKVRSGLALIKTFHIQSYIDPSGRQSEIEANLFAELYESDITKYEPEVFIIFFNCTSYMFSFGTLAEALDCIQDFMDKDTNAILDKMDSLRCKKHDKYQNMLFIKEEILE